MADLQDCTIKSLIQGEKRKPITKMKQQRIAQLKKLIVSMII
jgi:hypothetical protein